MRRSFPSLKTRGAGSEAAEAAETLPEVCQIPLKHILILPLAPTPQPRILGNDYMTQFPGKLQLALGATVKRSMLGGSVCVKFGVRYGEANDSAEAAGNKLCAKKIRGSELNPESTAVSTWLHSGHAFTASALGLTRYSTVQILSAEFPSS